MVYAVVLGGSIVILLTETKNPSISDARTRLSAQITSYEETSIWTIMIYLDNFSM